MSDLKKELLADERGASVRLNTTINGRTARGASVTTAGTSNTVFGVPLGFVLVGVALLGVVAVVVVRMVRK